MMFRWSTMFAVAVASTITAESLAKENALCKGSSTTSDLPNCDKGLVCVWPAPLVLCADINNCPGVCKRICDHNNNPNDCAGPMTCGGVAGLKCPAGQKCVLNCPVNQSDCLGKCVKPALTSREVAACGGVAGIPCPVGYECNFNCPPNQSDCLGTCKPATCGGFVGKECPTGFHCVYSNGSLGTCKKD